MVEGILRWVVDMLFRDDGKDESTSETCYSFSPEIIIFTVSKLSKNCKGWHEWHKYNMSFCMSSFYKYRIPAPSCDPSFHTPNQGDKRFVT